MQTEQIISGTRVPRSRKKKIRRRKLSFHQRRMRRFAAYFGLLMMVVFLGLLYLLNRPSFGHL